ncbi:hypothetical protein Pelo_2693 [Pelomyxa schiedti]|nr:hypothetical protein Pelo_2693 [Pelomyxa schiedti]
MISEQQQAVPPCIVTLMSDLDLLEKELHQRDSVLEQYQDQILEYTKANKSLQHTVESQRKQIQNKDAQMEQISSVVHGVLDSSVQCAKLRKSLSEAEAKVSNIEKDFTFKLETVQKSNREHEDTIRRLQSRIADMESSTSRELNQAKGERDSAVALSKVATQDLEAMKTNSALALEEIKHTCDAQQKEYSLLLEQKDAEIRDLVKKLQTSERTHQRELISVRMQYEEHLVNLQNANPPSHKGPQSDTSTLPHTDVRLGCMLPGIPSPPPSSSPKLTATPLPPPTSSTTAEKRTPKPVTSHTNQTSNPKRPRLVTEPINTTSTTAPPKSTKTTTKARNTHRSPLDYFDRH